jgi:hypothetical protein
MKVTAHAVRSAGWWAVDVPEVPGVFTQARRLDQVPGMVADAVALMAEVPTEDVEVELAPDLPPRMAKDLARARVAQDRADQAAREAATAKRQIVRQLREDVGLSVRDVGIVVGISPQRVSQLT